MTINPKMITAYYADWVRGPAGKENGDTISQSVIEDNLKRARERCSYLRGLTGWQIYCPHDKANEDVVAAGWRESLINSSQILAHSAEIVKACNIFILGGDPDRSEGVKYELKVAENVCKPIMLALGFWSPQYGGIFTSENEMAIAMGNWARITEQQFGRALTINVTNPPH